MQLALAGKVQRGPACVGSAPCTRPEPEQPSCEAGGPATTSWQGCREPVWTGGELALRAFKQ
eukprot:13916027-Alexandrium_andersonii.AAC.1